MKIEQLCSGEERTEKERGKEWQKREQNYSEPVEQGPASCSPGMRKSALRIFSYTTVRIVNMRTRKPLFTFWV